MLIGDRVGGETSGKGDARHASTDTRLLRLVRTPSRDRRRSQRPAASRWRARRGLPKCVHSSLPRPAALPHGDGKLNELHSWPPSFYFSGARRSLIARLVSTQCDPRGPRQTAELSAPFHKDVPSCLVPPAGFGLEHATRVLESWRRSQSTFPSPYVQCARGYPWSFAMTCGRTNDPSATHPSMVRLC